MVLPAVLVSWFSEFVFGLKPGAIPVDVILIIMGVIAAIAAMQVAGGLDYLVHLAAKILKSNPKYITFLAPLVTYTMTMFAGTGHTAFSTLPVIAEVAKREGIRPSRPLSIATVGAQIGITASPISAAVVFFSSELEKYGVDYVQLLMIAIPSSFIAVMLGAFIANFLGKELKDDPVYQDRLAKGLVSMDSMDDRAGGDYSGSKTGGHDFWYQHFCCGLLRHGHQFHLQPD